MRCFHVSVSRFLVVFALVACLVSAVGCGSDGLSGPTGTVTGKVTYNDAPVPAGCVVTFVNQESSLPATGVVAADGTYTLTMKGEGQVTVGPYKISISTAADETDITADEEAYAAQMMGGDAASSKPPPFPAIYFSPITSGLSYTVTEGENTHDIPLVDE